MNQKKKRIIIIFSIVIGLIIILFGVWKIIIEKQVQLQNNEKLIKDATNHYFELNNDLLPTEIGKSKRISLAILYEQKYLKQLYIQSKACNLEKSWVNTKKTNNDYDYTIYLECGKIHSKVDNLGPVITLNGDMKINIDIDSEYQELGIKEIKDNIDGVITASNAIIKNNVNSQKLGSYEVIYSVKDSLGNETTITRIVNVIYRLKNAITKDTNNENIYRGNTNNYVLFSGMMWQIVKINDDSTIKLVTANNIGITEYGNSDFNQSNLQKWLNDYFYSHLAKSSKQYILEDSLWCLDKTNDSNYQDTTCNNYSNKMPVGLLTLSEFNHGIDNGINNLDNNTLTSFLTLNNDNEVWTYSNINGYMTQAVSKIGNVRPTINVKNTIYITSGVGTFNNPYKLNDYDYGKENELFSNRISGEYIRYSGHLFRILDVNENGTVSIIMNEHWKAADKSLIIASYETNSQKYNFNPDEEANLGFILNNAYIDDISLKNVLPTTYEVCEFINDKLYNERVCKEHESLITIPDIYDMFSSYTGSMDNYSYWLRTASQKEDTIFKVTSLGTPLEVNIAINKENYVRLILTLKSNLKIAKGKGLINNPYYVK